MTHENDDELFVHVRKGQAGDADYTADLSAYHTRIPAATERTYGSLRTLDGRTSYALLLDHVGDLSDRVVVDVACGNGPLMEVIARRFPGVQQMIGVDVCAADLVLARQRLAARLDATRWTLLEHTAQDVEIAPASVDVVCCHMALMLFRPLAPVVATMQRMLKPGGLMVAVIPSPDAPHPLTGALMAAMRDMVVAAHPQLQAFTFGDPTARSTHGFSVEDILRLFSPVAGWCQTPDLVDHDLWLRGPTADVVSRLGDFFYWFELLSSDDKRRLQRRWLDMLQASAGDDGRCGVPFRLATCRVARVK